LGLTLFPDSKESYKPRSAFLALLVLYTLLCFATMLILTVLRLAFSFAVLAAAALSYNARPFAASLGKRRSLQVDLDYDVYQGVANSSTGSNTWKGYAVWTIPERTPSDIYSIRFAAPPIGPLHWQAPQPPALFCPQSPDAPNGPGRAYGNEDCLFLNVYAPANASSLPVLVWIHGGGYGAGNGGEDLPPIINANHNNFVGVAIQYRVWISSNYWYPLS